MNVSWQRLLSWDSMLLRKVVASLKGLENSSLKLWRTSQYDSFKSILNISSWELNLYIYISSPVFLFFIFYFYFLRKHGKNIYSFVWLRFHKFSLQVLVHGKFTSKMFSIEQNWFILLRPFIISRSIIYIRI